MAGSPLAALPIGEFLHRLASEAPTPGGGAAAALVGALAAALGRMACALTIGNPKFTGTKPPINRLAARLTRATRMLQQFIDEDAAAYAELSTAFKLERSDPQRPQRVEQSARLAAAVPLETLAVSRQVLADLRQLDPLANPNLRSDIEAGTHLARAAMQAAAANVRVNLALLPSRQAKELKQELERLLAE
jgi:formiminotetrahydrofolate cyclodeaminase